MNKKLVIVSFIAASTLMLFSFTNEPSFDALMRLASNREYFKLRKEFASASGKLKSEEHLFLKAVVDMTSNRPEKSIESIDALLRKGAKFQQNDSLMIAALSMKAFNHFKLFEYEKASLTSQQMLTQFANRIPAEQMGNFKNLDDIFRALKGAPRQTVRISEFSKVPVFRDKARLMNIPVKYQDSTYSFIFDTGANLSTITESYAKKMNVKTLEGKIEVGAFGGTAMASLGVCPEFSVGNATFNNVVFLVFPDSTLTFKSFNYKINAILGFPIMNALGEIRFNKDNTLEVPKTKSKADFSNLALDGLQPLIELEFQKQGLVFNFDTGANRTDLYQRFYDTYGKSLHLTDGKTKLGGAGGTVENVVKIADTVRLSTGDKRFTLTNVTLHTKVIRGNTYSFGNIGQDFIQQYSGFTLNLKDMFISFHKD